MRFVTCVGFVGSLLLSVGSIQAATVIDFEDWTGGSDVQYMVRSHGYVLGGSLIVGPVPGTNNPTNALHSLGHWIKMGITGSTFSLRSLDLQEGSVASQTARIELVGRTEKGGQVVETLTLDGLGSTFETFRPVEFSGLVGVFCYAYTSQGDPSAGFSVDNIVIPEPVSAWLMVLGLLVVGRRRLPQPELETWPN